MPPPTDDLTLPASGSTTTRRWMGAYLKRVYADLGAIPLGRFDSRVFDAFADQRAELGRLARSGDAGLVFSILRRATCSTLVRSIHRELWAQGDVDRLDALLAELTSCIAIELAAAGHVPGGEVRFARHPARILAPSLGIAVQLDDDVTLRVRSGELVVSRGSTEVSMRLDDAKTVDGAVVERPFHTIRGTACLATVDNNPLSEFEAHPDKSGNTLDLGGKPVSEWTRALGGALDLVRAHLPDLADEMDLVMQHFIPVGWDGEKHLSASYAEAIGVAYLTLHPDPMTMAEAVVHEFSHNKINAVWTVAPLLENGFAPLFSSPVRPDPRPLHGVLLAAHAFVPVARLYELMLASNHDLARTPRFRERFEQIVRGNAEAIETLRESAVATREGAAVLAELERWGGHFRGVTS